MPRAFTDEEFDKMVKEMLRTQPAVFDTLYTIAYKTVHKWIVAECAGSKVLHGREYEDEIFDDVCIKLFKRTVTDFLLKSGNPEEVNYDPDGFKSWIFAIAKTTFLDTLKRVEREDSKIDVTDIGDTNVAFNEDMNGGLIHFQVSENTEKIIKNAMDILLCGNRQPFIVMTWVAMCVFILVNNISKIEANHTIVSTFLKKSLYEIYDYLFERSGFDKAFGLSDDLKQKVKNNLNIIKEGKCIGDMTYGELFGDAEPLVIISKWECRVNKLIKKVMNYDTPER